MVATAPSLFRLATAIAARRVVTDASGYKLAIPARAIRLASSIAWSLSNIPTLRLSPTQGAWIHGGFPWSGLVVVFFSLLVTAAIVSSSGDRCL